jgi:hypothetical protein
MESSTQKSVDPYSTIFTHVKYDDSRAEKENGEICNGNIVIKNISLSKKTEVLLTESFCSNCNFHWHVPYWQCLNFLVEWHFSSSLSNWNGLEYNDFVLSCRYANTPWDIIMYIIKVQKLVICIKILDKNRNTFRQANRFLTLEEVSMFVNNK